MTKEFLGGGEEPKIPKNHSEQDKASGGEGQSQPEHVLPGKFTLPHGEHYLPPGKYSKLFRREYKSYAFKQCYRLDLSVDDFNLDEMERKIDDSSAQ